jgi:Zn-dependent peptidase ImmA (M78 family)/transcriptional regulator with XRE-family HTH domain
VLGSRLKSARTAAGLSLRALADAVGVSAMALSKYERDRMRPSPAVLEALAKALDVPVGHFTEEAAALELRDVEYRAHRRLTPISKRLIHEEIRRQLALRREIEAVVPETRTPPFKLPRLPGRIARFDEIEGVADAVRGAWGLGEAPIASVTNLLEAHGVRVVHVDSRDGWFDGLSCRIDDVPVVVVGADWPGDRQRFTLAHELGHLALSGRLDPRMDEERACHRFAGAWLAPASRVAALVIGPEVAPLELALLKHEWGLSMQAWIFRLRDVGKISEDASRALWRAFVRNGWRETEPGPPYPKETATAWQRSVSSLVANGRLAAATGAAVMGMEEAEFERLLGMG